MDFDATEIFNLPKISRNRINKILGKTRRMIFVVSQKAEKDYREFELAKNYFGAKRIKGKRGRVALGKTPVCGLLKTYGKKFMFR